jgi:hypothetical protein
MVYLVTENMDPAGHWWCAAIIPVMRKAWIGGLCLKLDWAKNPLYFILFEK